MRSSSLPAVRTTSSSVPSTRLAGPALDVGRAPVHGSGLAGPLVFAALVTLGLFGGFGTWAALAPLESASVAPGSIVVESNRKAVQHLEGGVVGDLRVEEGQAVTAGQILVRLDRTIAQANLDMLKGQLISSLALEARLRAERDGLPEIAPSPVLDAFGDDARARESIAAELRIFAARREQIESQTRILQQRNLQVDEEIKGLQQEIKSQDRQLQLLREEVATVGDLVRKGLERTPRLLALQRLEAEVEGQRAQNIGRIARGKQSIGEGEMRILDLRSQMLADAVQKLRDEQARISDLTEKLRSVEDVLKRTDIVAPATGRVVGLKLFTVGGVVPPRETLMEIVPLNDSLIVEAQMPPYDIDVVSPGQAVQLRFTALNQRTTPTLIGHVTQISADRMTDPRSGAGFYQLRATIDPAQPGLSSLKLYPGMPVEVAVVTGQRTLLDYIAKPLTDSLRRSFREE